MSLMIIIELSANLTGYFKRLTSGDKEKRIAYNVRITFHRYKDVISFCRVYVSEVTIKVL